MSLYTRIARRTNHFWFVRRYWHWVVDKYKVFWWPRRTYPAYVVQFPPTEKNPEGSELVLVRNLATHQYGGWGISLEDAEKKWGRRLVNSLPRFPSDLAWTREG